MCFGSVICLSLFCVAAVDICVNIFVSWGERKLSCQLFCDVLSARTLCVILQYIDISVILSICADVLAHMMFPMIVALCCSQACMPTLNWSKACEMNMTPVG